MKDISLLILAAAKLRFSRFGFQKTTMDEISHDCRISKKTLYQYFHNKNDLFMRLLSYELAQLKAGLFAQPQDVLLPIDRLPRLLKAISLHFLENHFLLQTLRDEEAMFPSSRQTVSLSATVEKEITALIAAVVSEGKKQNQFRDMDENLVAYLGFKLLQTLLNPKAGLSIPDKTAAEYYTGEFIDLFVNGIVQR